MAARIVFITGHRRVVGRERTVRLREDAVELAREAPELSRELLALLDRYTASPNAWSFVMLGPTQNRAVVRWINANAKRPRMSAALWAEFFCNLHTGTGEITMSRKEMAAAVGASPQHVSDALSELLRFGALIRRQEGRDVRWFLNPRVATCVTGAAREEVQRSAPPLLTVMQGGVVEP